MISFGIKFVMSGLEDHWNDKRMPDNNKGMSDCMT